jgi:hypothetical protein
LLGVFCVWIRQISFDRSLTIPDLSVLSFVRNILQSLEWDAANKALLSSSQMERRLGRPHEHCSTLGRNGLPNSMRIEPAKPVAWTEKNKHAQVSGPDSSAPPGSALMQPERWIFSYGGPDAIVQAEYWRGNRSVGVTTTSNGFAATLANLHKGVGMPIAWILLVDTLAGSLMFLSISGVALWMLTHRRRRVGFVIFGTSVALTLGLVLAQL